ncbi:Ras-related protein Rab-8A [Histomonas meleagridis]|uniref:Ras-related protein Rab-8A n=1 Tax=Histomonas meleagridis TaxID=135588 RepID=UPI003559440D|nr:Ras-related protein Rab-8A [Histomonas meleagridis]KAH0799195.1 Ras-related protein Rab-8A [Histomonas meleagridis]
MVIDEKPIKLQVWDTLGQEQYRTITKAFLRGADGIFLIFDYTNKSSFEMLGDWMDSIIKNSDGHITVFLIGNKCDQEKVVSQDEVLKFKAKYDLPLFEMSAKSNINVNETFFEAGKIIKERKEREAKEKKEEAEAQAQVAEDKKPKKKTNKEACNVY